MSWSRRGKAGRWRSPGWPAGRPGRAKKGAESSCTGLLAVKAATVAARLGGWPGLYTAGILRAWFAEVEMTDVQGEWPAADAVLDTSGLNCPLPLLKAKLELNRLASGAVLHVTATDAGSQRDFRAFARLAGHALVHEEEAGGGDRDWPGEE